MGLRMLLKHRCNVGRNTLSSAGGVIKSGWNDTFATDVPLLVQEKRGVMDRDETGVALTYDAVAFFSKGQDVKPRGQDDKSDRITMTKPTAFNGIKFSVVHVADESGQDKFLTAYLKRLPAKTGN